MEKFNLIFFGHFDTFAKVKAEYMIITILLSLIGNRRKKEKIHLVNNTKKKVALSQK